MKKGKLLTMAVSILLVLCTALGATACARGPKITGDTSKVNLLVWNYDGGVGHAWLDDVVARFEAAKAETVYEGASTKGQDLKGVDITVYNTKDDPLDTISTKTHTVFFLQNVKCRKYMTDGAFLDISDIVTETLAGEEQSIEDKMSEELRGFLKKDDKYYALPHYQTFDGIVYNKTLFDEKGFYFAKNQADYMSNVPTDPGYGFINAADAEKSCGPNGISGDYDDGLPSSIEEFERLCVYVTARGNDAFIWYKGNSGYNYQNKLVNALWASLEGYKGAMANFTFNTGDEETKIITDVNTLETESVKIDDTNAWKIYQQESRYYALELANSVFTGKTPEGSNIRRHAYTTKSTVSQTQVQQAFLEDDVAMMLEGSYWENEAETERVNLKKEK